MFSKKTKNLGLPLFQESDRAVWTDINYENNILDQSLGGTDAAVKDILNTAIPEIQGELSTLSTELNTVNTEIVSLKSRVTTVENKLGTVDIKEMQRQLTSLSGTVGNLQTEINTLDARVETIEDDVANTMTKIRRYGQFNTYETRPGATGSINLGVDVTDLKLIILDNIVYLNGVITFDEITYGDEFEVINIASYVTGIKQIPGLKNTFKLTNIGPVSEAIFTWNVTHGSNGNFTINILNKYNYLRNGIGNAPIFLQCNMSPIGTFQWT